VGDLQNHLGHACLATTGIYLKASRAMKKEEKIYGQKLAEMAKMHFQRGFLCP
jgi:hypothetical protein